MSKTDTTTDGDGEQDERMQVADGVFIEDAFVNWWLNAANKPVIVAVTNKEIPRSDWEPVEADPTDDIWVVQNDHGLWAGWQKSRSTENAAPTTVEHAELGTVEDRYWSYDHVVAAKVNDAIPNAVASVRFRQGPKGSPQPHPVWVGVIHEIVEKYINGPLGSEKTPMWYWMRSHPDGYGWHQSPNSKEEFEPYLTPEVVLVKDWNYTWYPKRREDVVDTDEVFRPGGEL